MKKENKERAKEIAELDFTIDALNMELQRQKKSNAALRGINKSQKKTVDNLSVMLEKTLKRAKASEEMLNKLEKENVSLKKQVKAFEYKEAQFNKLPFYKKIFCKL